MARANLTRAQLAKEADVQLRNNARETLKKFWSAVGTKLDAGDNKTMEMVGRMFQYDKGPGGVTIFNQHLQVNGPNGGNEPVARVRSFDQIIGKLEEQENLTRANRMISAPVENSEDEDDEDIQDAETEDIAESQETGELVGQ